MLNNWYRKIIKQTKYIFNKTKVTQTDVELTKCDKMDDVKNKADDVVLFSTTILIKRNKV